MEQIGEGQLLAQRYRLVSLLGAGATGSTWEAEDRLWERALAVKVVPDADPQRIESLWSEFELLRELFHPRLAQAYDVGVDRSRSQPLYFHTRALVSGVTLDHFDGDRSVPLADAIEALAFLHSLGVLHADFKPANIIVGEDGRGTLIDLGCAARSPVSPDAALGGTPGFVAPERLRGEPVDLRADVYAVGKTFERLGLDVLPDLMAAAPRQRPELDEVLRAMGRSTRTMALRGRAPRILGRAGELARFDALLAEGSGSLEVVGPSGIGKTRLLRELMWRSSTELDIIETRSDRMRGIRAALEPATGPISRGPDGVLAAVERLERPTLLVIDDADRNTETRTLTSLLLSIRVRGLFVLAATTRPIGEHASELGALSEDDLAVWAPTLSPTAIGRLRARTGGHPADVEAALHELVLARTTELAVGSVPTASPESDLTRGLGDAERRVLAALAVGLDRAAPAETLLELQRGGWIGVGNEGPRLRRPALVPVLEAALGPEVRDAHAAALEELGPEPVDPVERSHHAAARVVHLHGAGRATEAREALIRNASGWGLAPDGWRRAADRLEPEGALGARMRCAIGHPREAFDGLVRSLTRDPNGLADPEIRRELGRAYLLLGDARRARRHLRHSPDDGESADLAARACIQAGAHAEARSLVEASLMEASGPVRASLEETRGVAALYLGDLETSRRALELAASGSGTLSPRERIRRRSYAGIASTRAGDVLAAHGHFAAALRDAEEAGLADPLASAALNLGTAAQRLGHWGEAIECYGRAQRLAAALRKRNTELTLRFNEANLRAAVGDWGGASAQLEGLADAVREIDLAHLAPSIRILEGEIALARGELRHAEQRFQAAVTSAKGAPREALEARIGLAEVALQRGGAPDDALLDDAEPHGDDLLARAHSIIGRAHVAAGRASTGLRHLERAVELAADERDLAAELAWHAATAAEKAGAKALAARHRERAQAEWERLALGLGGPLLDHFWRHPLRERSTDVGEDDPDLPALERVLAINRELTESLSAERVLERALDAAIELTGAERGFVLLRDADGRLSVSVARNVDRERLGRSHLKFSRSIAEAVVRDGRSVVTADASDDDRFRDHRSVLAMRLTSVACVPIRTRERVLGAIYVDNRFERGRFSRRASRLLSAFADQVAVALENARLHAELLRRTQDLEEERARVAELLTERERELEELHAQRRQRVALPTQRYDFGPLVGRSSAMRELLGTLERVIDTPLSVLIQGESGTGKELVARALHELGPRSARPFVSINCAAMPASLLESELFGHVRGAFTGADHDRDGLLVVARGGTLLLDEVGEMPASMQAKLLRVLQEREVRRLGSAEVIPIDLRVLAATNRDLHEEVAAGRFREDLYYRLAVVELHVPALRDRLDDLPLLASALLARKAEEMERQAPAISRDAMRQLLRHDWPGNVRELENVLSRALVLAAPQRALQAVDLELRTSRRTRTESRASHRERERERILEQLEDTGWNVSEVSRRMTIPRNTLYRRMKRYGISRP